jgi:hypothetical protein
MAHGARVEVRVARCALRVAGCVLLVVSWGAGLKILTPLKERRKPKERFRGLWVEVFQFLSSVI